MNRPRIRFLMICGILLSMLVACAEEPPESNLMRLLRFVPDKRDYREYVTFGDAAAWHTSWDVSRLDDLDDLEALGSYPMLGVLSLHENPWLLKDNGR